MSGEYEDEYEDEVDSGQVNDLIDRVNSAESRNAKMSQAIQTMSAEKKDGNFLHYQLSTDELLDRLEHFYRSDFQGYDDDGDLVWKKQTNTDLVTFNDFGVSAIMEIVSKYVDKNTILSDYSEERIYQILSDIGDELIMFILCNYEKMGMDTHFKKTKFRLIITTTTHIIESTYRRAKSGNTLKEINQSRVVGQFANPMQVPQGRPKQQGFFNRMFN